MTDHDWHRRQPKAHLGVATIASCAHMPCANEAYVTVRHAPLLDVHVAWQRGGELASRQAKQHGMAKVFVGVARATYILLAKGHPRACVLPMHCELPHVIVTKSCHHAMRAIGV